MRTVRTDAVIGVLAEAALLAAIAAGARLGVLGWLVGLAAGTIVNLTLARGLIRSGTGTIRLANLVTLVRATLAGGVAALVADAWVHPVRASLIVGLSTVALVLDAVDGRVARRTGTVTPLGARFDMEVDAFLILVLSAQVARWIGVWVLAIGLARYLFVAAGWVWPWLRAQPPTRYWCKVVAAIQGIVLTAAAAGAVPRIVMILAVAIALALLAESFGRDVWWLHQLHAGLPPAPVPTMRMMLGWAATMVAVLVVWVALVLPSQASELTPGGFVRIPVEGVAVVALAVVLPRRTRVGTAIGVGVLLAVLTVVKVLDLGFSTVLDRPFNPLTDWGTFGPAVGVVRDSVGSFWARVAVVGAVLLVLIALVLITASVVRLTRLSARHRRGSTRAVAAVGAVWLLCAATGLSVAGAPIASSGTAAFAYDQARRIDATVHDQQTFGSALTADDRMARVAPRDLLAGLRGKDVILAVVESYGQVAVQNSPMAGAVDATLRAGTTALGRAGFAARSAFLTSSTFGGISWLAHSTLQSGLWIDSQQRYDQLLASTRFTLTAGFAKAGWRTVDFDPSNYKDWPEGKAFYHYDQVYDVRNVGYEGPRFSYATMPDEYALAAFQRRELSAPGRRPVMAEIDLVSSHTPWAPLPHMVAWNRIGDGSIFDGMPQQGSSPGTVWQDARRVKQAYGASIRYTLDALVSFVQHAHDNNLVLVVVGDHQPASIVSGPGATHNVPISIIAHDPRVLGRIASWGWQDGLLPGPHAPVLPMDRFRDRFLAAYGP